MLGNHFSDRAWVDFVRGVATSELTERIQRHLDAACQECGTSLRIWQSAGRVIRHDRDLRSPDAAIRLCIVQYSEWLRRRAIRQHAGIARLISDTRLDPVPVGVRADAAPTRRILWRLEPWVIDLRLEPEGGKRVLLVGQLLRSGQRYSGSGEVEISPVDGERVLAKSSINEFGEFQVQFEQARNLRMYIELPGHPPVAVDLPDPDNPEPLPDAGDGAT